MICCYGSLGGNLYTLLNETSFYIEYEFPLFSMNQWDFQLEPSWGQDQGEAPRVPGFRRWLLSQVPASADSLRVPP